jgi:hypothetical protein
MLSYVILPEMSADKITQLNTAKIQFNLYNTQNNGIFLAVYREKTKNKQNHTKATILAFCQIHIKTHAVYNIIIKISFL